MAEACKGCWYAATTCHDRTVPHSYIGGPFGTEDDALGWATGRAQIGETIEIWSLPHAA